MYYYAVARNDSTGKTGLSGKWQLQKHGWFTVYLKHADGGRQAGTGTTGYGKKDAGSSRILDLFIFSSFRICLDICMRTLLEHATIYFSHPCLPIRDALLVVYS
jgi:hypothetical protein